MAIEEELLDQRRALAAARGLALHHLPSLAIEIIGMLSELQLQRAEGINKGIDQRVRESRKRNRLTNKLHFVFLRMGCCMLLGGTL